MGRLARQSNDRIARLLGDATYDLALGASRGIFTPVPLLYPGAPSFLYDGMLFPHISGGGFSSLSDLIAEMTSGKVQNVLFNKAGNTGVVGTANTLWNVGSVPATGASPGTTGTGVARVLGDAGSLAIQNPGGSDTLHFIGGTFMGSIGTQMLLLYDRLWDMTHTMTVDPRSNDAAHLPTRYQDATAAGTVITGEVTTILPASSPTVTFMYVNEAGGNSTSPANTIRASAAANTTPFPLGQWFATDLAADKGIRAIQNNASAIDLSAAMASGVVTWFLAHPIALIPMPIANTPVLIDGINSAINLVQIMTGACLSFLEIKGATNATNWFGNVLLASG
jgi:hypothetical protein